MKKPPRVEYQCTSSSFLLPAFYFLSLPLQQSPVTPLAISFFPHCPPSLCTFFFLSRLPSPACHLSSSSSPSPRPSVAVSPPIQVHTSQVSARPYAPLPSLGGVAAVTGRMDDRQGPAPPSSASSSSSLPPLFEAPHAARRPPTNESHTALDTQAHTRIHKQ